MDNYAAKIILSVRLIDDRQVSIMCKYLHGDIHRTDKTRLYLGYGMILKKGFSLDFDGKNLTLPVHGLPAPRDYKFTYTFESDTERHRMLKRIHLLLADFCGTSKIFAKNNKAFKFEI